jgi:hypothetical protein
VITDAADDILTSSDHRCFRLFRSEKTWLILSSVVLWISALTLLACRCFLLGVFAPELLAQLRNRCLPCIPLSQDLLRRTSERRLPVGDFQAWRRMIRHVNVQFAPGSGRHIRAMNRRS